MALLKEMFITSHTYLTCDENMGWAENQLIPPFDTVDEAQELLNEMRRKIYAASEKYD
jgi:hypothetical protein